MVGNGGQSSRAGGVELHLRTAVWGQQAVLALSGLAAVPDRRLVDQRRGDSGQRRPDIFDVAFQQYGRRSTGAARGCGARGGSACGQSRAGAVVQPGGVCAASGFHDWGCVAHFIEPAQSRLAEFRYVAEQAIRAGRGPDAGVQCDGVRFHESRQLERSGQRDRIGGDAEPGCGQDHWFARRTCDSIGFEAELLRQAATVLLLAWTLIAAPPKPTSHTIRVAVWADATDVAHLAANLAAKDLSATVAGTESRVVDVKGPGDDLMLVAVLDLAGDLSLAEPAKDALAADIEKLPRRTAVAVMRAQDGAKVLADPGTDRAAAVSAVRDLPVSGKAGLLDTVETVTRLADSILAKASVRVAVRYVTDSDPENYREDFTNPVINSSDTHDLSRKFPEALIQDKISKVAAVLAQRQAPLFVVHLRYRSDRLGEAYQNGLKQLAEVTGGSAIFCRSSEEIADAIRRALGLITSSYSVAVALPELRSKVFDLRLDAGGKCSLTYRTRFVLKER